MKMSATNVPTAHGETDFQERTSPKINNVEEDWILDKIRSAFSTGQRVPVGTGTDSSPEDLQESTPENYEERDELPDASWKEDILRETRPLAQWCKRNRQYSTLNAKEDVFAPCLFPHPHDLFGTPGNGRLDDDENLEHQKNLTLDDRLRRIAQDVNGKLIPLRHDENLPTRPMSPEIFRHHADPKNALDTYCQAHAYSRTRLSRTDRRALANELLEILTEESQDSEPELEPEPRPDAIPRRTHRSVLHAPRNFVKSWNEGSKKYADLLQIVRPSVVGGEPNGLKPFLGRRTTSSALAFPVTAFNKLPDQGFEVKGQRLRSKNETVLKINGPLVVTSCHMPPSQNVAERRNPGHQDSRASKISCAKFSSVV